MKNNPVQSSEIVKTVAIPELSPHQFYRFESEYHRYDKPVILRGKVAHWGAVREWTPEYFLAHYADQPVTPSINLPERATPYESYETNHREKMIMSEFLQHLSEGQRCYIDQSDISPFQGLENDFEFSEIANPPIAFVSLWVGHNTRSGLHYDNMDNSYVQVFGNKKVWLVPPDESRYVYPFADSVSKSKVDPENPDLVKYPKFARATPLVATLEPGDMLYFPRGWWHHFKSLGTSVSLSCWHGQALTVQQQVKAVNDAGIHLWGQIFRDFVWHGVFGKAYQQRLFSTPPTGKMLYDLIFPPGKTQ
ncbi:MAG: cupin-like domain-containing protein [Pseudomonadales bacterium]|nr:cupin-like domain-containing protein [Pseudomonadales bacterium]